jgi:inosose dehydratase
MRIGISRFSNTPQESYELLEAARRYGFEGVQLKPSQYQEFVATPTEFQNCYGDLAALACGGLIVYPGGEPSEWHDKAKDILTFAGAINAEHICFCSGVYGTNASDEQVRAVADALMEIGAQANTQNLVISIHNHVDSLVESENDIARLLEIVDPDLCGLTLDTAHAAKAGIPHVEKLVTRFQQHLINVHLKDLGNDGEFCALGQGTLDIRPILRALADINYQQWLIVDEETKNKSTEETFRIASDYLKREAILS